jgi:hypothetical protein
MEEIHQAGQKVAPPASRSPVIDHVRPFSPGNQKAPTNPALNHHKKLRITNGDVARKSG